LDSEESYWWVYLFLPFFSPSLVLAKDYQILSADEWINVAAPRAIKNLIVSENGRPVKMETRLEPGRVYFKWFYTARGSVA
jgi:hypothetical protein